MACVSFPHDLAVCLDDSGSAGHAVQKVKVKFPGVSLCTQRDNSLKIKDIFIEISSQKVQLTILDAPGQYFLKLC